MFTHCEAGGPAFLAKPYLNRRVVIDGNLDRLIVAVFGRFVNNGSEKIMPTEKYFIGLDMGTDSVGWAVTDCDYKICKCGGKAMWGVRLFDEAKTSAERRTVRIARRGTERHRQRLGWLQEVFSPEIAKVDPAFYQRLAESKFSEDDKIGELPLGKYTLFADKSYNDIHYHREFPTIYHLRYALMMEDREFDVRLVYLAVHHIMKHRGHFLFVDLTLDEITFDLAWKNVCEYMDGAYSYCPELADADAFQQVLMNSNVSVSQKAADLKKIADFARLKKGDSEDIARNKQTEAIYEALAGKTVKLAGLCADAAADAELSSFSFKGNWEDLSPKLALALGDDFEFILRLKAVYDWSLLASLRSGHTYLSEARIASYEKHKSDLAKLKTVVRAACPERFFEIFHESKDKLNNYVAYTGHALKRKGQSGYCYYRCSYDDFARYIKGILQKTENPEAESIIAELENGTFLPKQATKDNSIIPYQLHRQELEIILERASRYLPFLNETDDSGLTRREQIIQMFTFRIPYYIGPLSLRSEHAWLERGEGKIYPWNFNQVVDVERSAEKFIECMTAKCSYLGEDILPRDSLLYSKFAVLNELNGLRVHGRPVSVETKQRLYRDLFLNNPSKRKITQKQLLACLIRYGEVSPEERNDVGLIGGVKDGFNAKLTSWIDFADILERGGMENAVEDVIRHIVLFSSDKRLLTSWLEKTYGERFSDEEKKKILRLKYSEWGSLSAKLLTEIYHTDEATGEAVSIIEQMWRTNNNLMELLSSRFTYSERIAEYRQEKYGGKPLTLQDFLEDSYASPAIKRSINQTMKIVDEIVKVMKRPPARIFVEMARDSKKEKEGKKGNKPDSRKERLEKLYKSCGKECGELLTSLQSKTEGDLRRDKLYLYYTQMGRCMYSGEPISLNDMELSAYDIDHIYPRSLTKDDSLDNRVLVKHELNAAKKDRFPIDSAVIPESKQQQVRELWRLLFEKGLISKEKYSRLTRSTPLTDDELAAFIARQLVQTQQSTKIAAEWLAHKFGDATEIVYVKGGNVSDFRQDQRVTADGTQKQAGQCGKWEKTMQDPVFVKCREVNDFHHAKDAYLNIVVGNVYHVKFTRSPLNYVKKHKGDYSLSRVFDWDVSRGGEKAWTAGDSDSIAVVRSTMRKNNILFTRMPREVQGILADLQPVKKGLGQYPLKTSDKRMTIEKFGGYNKLTGSYFALVEHTIPAKGKKEAVRVRSIETILLINKQRYEADPVEYCKTVLQLEDPKVLIPCIKRNTLFSFDGFRMHITGRTDDLIIFNNANQLILSPEQQAYIKRLSKFGERKKAIPQTKVTLFDRITMEQNKALIDTLIQKLTGNLYSLFRSKEGKTIQQNIAKFEALSVEAQSSFLLDILKLCTCKPCRIDLHELGGSKTGQIRPSKKLTGGRFSSIKLIHQSVTGLFEQEIDLLKEDWQ